MILDKHSVQRAQSAQRAQTRAQEAILVVSGSRQAEGSFAEMHELFKSEIGRHRAPIEIRVKNPLVDGQPQTWRVAMKRAL